MGRPETASEQPAQFRLLPAIMLTLTKTGNQKAAAFWDMFNCSDKMETADCTECELTLS